MNWLKDKLVQRGLATTQISLGQLRSIRRFSVNNYERALNDLTGRVTSGASQQLATAQGLGAGTRGLLVGGQVGGGGSRTVSGSRAVNTGTPYINPTTGTQILPGTGPKGGSGGGAGAGGKGGGNITPPRTGQTTTQPPPRGAGGLPNNPFPE